MVLAGAVFGFWIYGWLTVVFSHSLWLGAAVVFTIAHGVIWAADHFLDPPSLNWHFQTTLTFGYWLGAFSAYAFVIALNSPLVVDARSVVHEKKRRTSLTPVSFWTAVLIVAAVLLTASINWLAGRYRAQLGLDQSTANVFGVISAVIGIVLLFLSVAFLITEYLPFVRLPQSLREERGRGVLNLKGLLVLGLAAFTMFFYDSFLDEPGRPWQGFIHLASVIVVYAIIVWPVLLFVPGGGPFDPFYRNTSTTLWFVLWVGVIHLGASAVGFATDEISKQDISAVWFAMLVYSVLIFVVFLAANAIGFRIVQPTDAAKKLERPSHPYSLSNFPEKRKRRDRGPPLIQTPGRAGAGQ